MQRTAEFHRNPHIYLSRLFAHRLSEFTVRSTPSLCSAKSHRVSTLHPTLTPRPRLYVRSTASSPALPKSQRECITHQRIRSSNILSCWMSELGIIIHYQFDEDHPFDLVLGFISRVGVLLLAFNTNSSKFSTRTMVF